MLIIGFMQKMLYTAKKVSYCRQRTPQHLYIDDAC